MSTAVHAQRFQKFNELMPHRLRDVLLVSSRYHAFILQEDGNIEDQVFAEFKSLSLSSAPSFAHVTTGKAALESLAKRPFDLVLVATRVPDMDLRTFSSRAREITPHQPLAVLAFDNPNVHRLHHLVATGSIDAVFVWGGSASILLAIIKYLEDSLNVTNDIQVADVGVILLVEESPQRYSTVLSALYPALMKQSRSLFSEGLNRLEKLIRMRTRPKVVHATNQEEALSFYERYRDNVMAVIADVGFPVDGVHDPKAGLRLARRVSEDRKDVPVLLQVGPGDATEEARAVARVVLDRGAPRLLQEMREFLIDHLGFGDFVFILPDGTEVDRATDIAELTQKLRTVPDRSLEFHASHNHISVWLMARSQFQLARRLKQFGMEEFDSIDAIRDYLATELETLQRRARMGIIRDASPGAFDPDSLFQRLGDGSLGGKARGLAFLNQLLSGDTMAGELAGLPVRVPQSIALTTDAYDEFLERNALDDLLHTRDDDDTILQRCLAASLPHWVEESLASIVDNLSGPLAVRSSSMLEDNLMHPFAGIYGTAMVPNSAPDRETRIRELHQAVKYVFATTFFANARAYIANTSRSIEEEKMGVLIQRLVGQQFGDRYYPHFAGVAQSYNHYPIEHQQASDGIVQLVLGLGAMVVDGGRALRFCPRFPEVIPGFAYPKQALRESQKHFYALDLTQQLDPHRPTFESNPVDYELEAAVDDGTFRPVGSSYDVQNNRIVEGYGLQGPRLVTFNNLLVHRAIPLAEALVGLLALARSAMGTEVEIELACDMGDWGRRMQRRQPRRPPTLYLLQLRPAAIQDFTADADLAPVDESHVICRTGKALGHGSYPDLCDIIYVLRDRFDPAISKTIAEEVGTLNQSCTDELRPYLLLGPGRWGSSDSWLGIPVQWAQISGARIIVEASPAGYDVDPSQGAHFFHNITSLGIGYLTIRPGATLQAPLDNSFVDWDWLDAQPAVRETKHLRHIRTPEPIHAVLDGRSGTGVIAW
jgi:CheY-like chemotaxis protein